MTVKECTLFTVLHTVNDENHMKRAKNNNKICIEHGCTSICFIRDIQSLLVNDQTMLISRSWRSKCLTLLIVSSSFEAIPVDLIFLSCPESQAYHSLDLATKIVSLMQALLASSSTISFFDHDVSGPFDRTSASQKSHRLAALP